MAAVRIVIAVIALIMLVWTDCNFITAGTFIGTAGFGAIAAVCLFWEPFCGLLAFLWRYMPCRIALVTLGSVIAVLAGFCVFFSVNMLTHIEKPLEKTDAVIVLGCQVKGETPSRMLRKRLNAALTVLNDNPGAVCVVSGGQGKGESVTEAEAMRRWLVENGIADDRIITENSSVNTRENIRFSAELLKARGITENVMIVTSEFHQYRAGIYAKREGLAAGAHSSHTKLLNLPNYWVREWCALFKQMTDKEQGHAAAKG